MKPALYIAVLHSSNKNIALEVKYACSIPFNESRLSVGAGGTDRMIQSFIVLG